MSLFPKLSPMIENDEDRSVKRLVEDFYVNAMMQNQEYLDEASVDTRFEAGDQSVYNELYALPRNNRKMFTFNRIKRIKNTVCGIQRRDKKSIIATGRGNEDSEVADQFTKIFLWLDKTADVSESVAQAFEGAFITGLNFVQVSLDYRNDPISGDIVLDVCPYNSFVIDPFFRKRDLSDCNAIWKRTFLTKDECASLLPDKEDIIMKLSAPYVDDKFQYMPENSLLNKHLLAYDEFYYRDYREKIIIVDNNLGETMEWPGDPEDVKDFVEQYPQLTYVKTKVPTVKLAILVNGKVMYNGCNPLGIDEYPFVGVFGYFTPSARDLALKIQGVVRGLRDAQFIYNRQKVAQFQLMENKPRPRFIYKPDSLIDKTAVFKLESGYSIGIKSSASMEDIREVATQDEVSQANIQLTQMMATEMEQEASLNEELLGSATDDKAALLAARRSQASLTSLQTLFSQLDTSLGLLGTLLMKVVQKNFAPGKVKQIIDKDPAPAFYNKAFGRYDIVIEQGFDTATQRQMQLAELLHLREIGVKIPDRALINAAVIQNKKELLEMMEQEAQAAQEMEQMQAESNMREQEATTNMINAKAQSDLSLAKKHEASITKGLFDILNQAGEASRDEQKLDLDTLETLNDINEFDVEKVEALSVLSNLLKEQREKEAEKLILDQQEQQMPAQQEIPMEQPMMDLDPQELQQPVSMNEEETSMF